MQVCIFFAGLLVVAFGAPANDEDPMINEGLFEGDILRDPLEFTNAVPNDSQRWPDGVVTYAIAPELNGIKPLILSAMQHIENVTCLHFVERTNEDDYVWIYNSSGCFSAFGRKGGKQNLSLGNNCGNFAVIVHELIHAIGLEHEHSRSDRDDHLIINYENIDEDQWHNFKKLEPQDNRLLTEFDDNSIMLYGSRGFAKDYHSDKYSMVLKDGSIIEEIYNRTSMSVLDSMKINLLYGCNDASNN